MVRPRWLALRSNPAPDKHEPARVAGDARDVASLSVGTDALLITRVSLVVFAALAVAAAVTAIMAYFMSELGERHVFVRELGERHVPGRLAAAAFLVVLPIVVGFGLASETTRAPELVSLSNDIWVLVIFGFVPLVWQVRKRQFRPWLTALVLAYFLALLLEIFTDLYWSYGTSKNFTIPLSHLDAFYFTLGTLTTGTGNISAISETSRGIQTAQMGFDFLLIGFILALLITRYSTLFDRPRRGLPPGLVPLEPAHSSDRGEPSPDAITPNHPGADHPPGEHAPPEETAGTKSPPARPAPPG
jgi:hypothetical protein